MAPHRIVKVTQIPPAPSGSTTWVNLACLTLLAPLVYRIYRDYERQRRLGLDPVFDPQALGIKGADFWEETRRSAHRALRGWA